MKKWSVYILLLCVAFMPLCFASVGVKVNGVATGVATDIDVTGTSSFDGSTLTIGSTSGTNLIAAGLANGGGTSLATNVNAVPVTYSYVKKAISTLGGTAGTIADGVAGQILTVYITQVDDGTWTLTPTTKLHYASITLDAAGDYVTLLFVDSTYGWQVISSNSITINH